MNLQHLFWLLQLTEYWRIRTTIHGPNGSDKNENLYGEALRNYNELSQKMADETKKYLTIKTGQ